jgi:hypothetical protein
VKRPFERSRDSLEDITCLRCLQPKPARDLDRLLWCKECVVKARRRAARRGWIAGTALAVVLGLYIGLVIRPDLSLIPALWVATLLIAFYLGARVTRELLFGLDRVRNRPAAEAVPPSPKE